MGFGKAHVICCRTQFSYRANNRNPIPKLVSRYEYKASALWLFIQTLDSWVADEVKSLLRSLSKRSLFSQDDRRMCSPPKKKKDRMNLACPEMSCSYSEIRSRQDPRAKAGKSHDVSVLLRRTTRDGFFSLFLIAIIFSVKELAGGCNLLLHCYRSVSACH